MTNPSRKLEIAERRAKVADMVRRGLRQREIAEQLGVDEGTISRDMKAIRTSMEDRAKRSIEVDRAMQRERLEAAVNAIWDDVQRGDAAAVRNLVRLVDRIARLEGLDMPTRVETTTVNLRQKLREMAEREGLDPDSAIAEAERYLRETGQDMP